MDPVLIAALCLALFLGVLLWNFRDKCHRPARRRHCKESPPTPDGHRYQPPKPPWVREEVLRLKALMPANGCRKIAVTFNHLFGQRRAMTVSKSYVAKVLRNSQAEVLQLQAEMKHRRPKPMPKNLTWAMDLTLCQGDATPILGVIDHGTRVCLALRRLRSKASIHLLRNLLDLIERFGSPRYLRTDNEAVFTSRLFRFVLALLGIRHQRSAPFAPWQNGRIERLFGTFKAVLRLRRGSGDEQLLGQDELDQFRAWYNFLRPHQHLDGWTPAWAWAKKAPDLRRKPKLYSAWDGVLAGYYWRE